MRIPFRATSCLLALLAAACTRQEPPTNADAPLTVTIGSATGTGLDSRTALGDDGFSIRWVKGDRIALWAVDDTGGIRLQAAPFALYSFDTDYRSAKFTGTVAPMPQGAYTYGALYPVPAATEGTKGIYTLPATQDGTYRSDYDVIASATVTGGALVDGDNSETVSLAFAHKVHLLKIRIPENRMNEPITRLQLTFPQPVTGTLAVDAAAPAAPAELTGGSNVLTLDFPTPVDAGATVYATIVPADIARTEPIVMQAFCESGESETISMPGKNFAAGHSTPIALTVPALGKRYTKLVFTLADTGEETLGEKIERLIVTGPEGCDLGQGGNAYTFDVTTAGTYEIIYKEGLPEGISGQAFTVTYDSENARITEPFVMPALAENAVNDAATFRVPYLFAEDFSAMGSFSHNDNPSTGGPNGVGNNGSKSLSELPGWTGARCGGEAGKAVRISSRNEYAGSFGVYVHGTYHGRIDSPALSNIKEGKTGVRIRITFNYSFGRATNKGTALRPRLSLSVTADSERDAHGSSSPGSDLYAPKVPGVAVQDLSGATNGGFDRIDLGGEAQPVFAEGCSNQHRLVWEVYMKDKESGSGFTRNTYSNNWAYIDNIKVSIAK